MLGIRCFGIWPYKNRIQIKPASMFFLFYKGNQPIFIDIFWRGRFLSYLAHSPETTAAAIWNIAN